MKRVGTIALLLLAVAMGGCQRSDSWSDVPPGTTPSTATTPEPEVLGGRLAGETLSDAEWQRAIEDVQAVTFKVLNHGCSFEASGSAVAVTATTLVTNRHVVAGARTMTVRVSHGAAIRVKSWVVSTRDDLALLSLAAPIGATPVTVAPNPTPGDLVAAVGYPLGGPLTAGRGRVVGVGDMPGPGATAITASMDILPGNSGGPLVNTDGELVGLIRAIDLVEGLAIAVPADRVSDLLNDEHTKLAPPCRP